MVMALAPPASANCRFQVARSLPLSVIKLLLVLKLVGPLTANAALPLAAATWERMLDRALAIQPSTDVCGETTLTPLARKAAYFASIITLIRLGSMANVAISL